MCLLPKHWFEEEPKIIPFINIDENLKIKNLNSEIVKLKDDIKNLLRALKKGGLSQEKKQYFIDKYHDIITELQNEEYFKEEI